MSRVILDQWAPPDLLPPQTHRIARRRRMVLCPPQIWLDNFVDTNGTALHLHTPDIGSGGYTDEVVQLSIESNECQVTSGSAVRSHFNPGNNVCTISGTASLAAAANCRAQIRYTTGNTCVQLQVAQGSSSNIKIQKVVSGTATTLATGSVTINAATSFTFSLQADGSNNLTSKINGANTLSANDATNSTQTACALSLSAASASTWFKPIQVTTP